MFMGNYFLLSARNFSPFLLIYGKSNIVELSGTKDRFNNIENIDIKLEPCIEGYGA